MIFPNRKQNRLTEFDYNTDHGYFITICSCNRKNLFWNTVGADSIRPQTFQELSAVGSIVKSAIEDIPNFYPVCSVNKYCIMPNHVHMILLPSTQVNGRIISAPTISTIIGQMKRAASKAVGFPIWQKSFYDHVIRNEQDYRDIWQYIENNPLKWEQDRFYTTDL